MSEGEVPLLIAEFGNPDALSDAARRALDAGFTPLDALSPCPVDGVAETLGLKQTPIRWPMLFAAFGVAAFAYGLEFWSAVYAYPIDSGGRPLNSWPVFLLVPFEVGVLSAAIAGFVALLVLCGLPRLNHPLFDWTPIERATDDRYFLLMRLPKDERENDRLRSVLLDAGALRVRGAARMKRALAVLAAMTVAGCTDQSMTRQPHYGSNAPAPVFANGSAAQTPPAGAVSQEKGRYVEASTTPPPVDVALLERGKERFGIFCAPCHGYEGDGDGAIVRRGFPRPPSYFEPHLMQAPAQLFFDTITNGYGVMYSYGSRVPPYDRWAIAVYIRALQQSRSTTIAEAPEAAAALHGSSQQGAHE